MRSSNCVQARVILELSESKKLSSTIFLEIVPSTTSTPSTSGGNFVKMMARICERLGKIQESVKMKNMEIPQHLEGPCATKQGNYLGILTQNGLELQDDQNITSRDLDLEVSLTARNMQIMWWPDNGKKSIRFR